MTGTTIVTEINVIINSNDVTYLTDIKIEQKEF
jgi:hypothetical protein